MTLISKVLELFKNTMLKNKLGAENETWIEKHSQNINLIRYSTYDPEFINYVGSKIKFIYEHKGMHLSAPRIESIRTVFLLTSD